MARHMKWLVVFAAAAALQAQGQDLIQRATIRGSRGTSGKCTLEVRVDIAAEVDVYGDSARLRNFGGQPASWVRMECSDPLPYRMNDFRFKGIDGRGNVQLIQDPRNNNGMAVVRIEDPKGGSEGYTFDLEWSGASGGAPTDGFSRNGIFDPNARGGGFGRRGGNRGMSAEQAIDLCRNEVRARGEREYDLRSIDITSAAADNGPGRRDWVVGTFNGRSGNGRRASGYRFSCAVDFNSGQVRTVEIVQADGRPIQQGGNGPFNQGGYDQNQVLRACQDAVVARTNRDGYQNVRFGQMGIDQRRGDRVTGTLTANRGPVTDTFDFGCSMDLRAGRVLNLDLNRR